MEKIDDPLQNDFGTLYQNIGLKMFNLFFYLSFEIIQHLGH